MDHHSRDKLPRSTLARVSQPETVNRFVEREGPERKKVLKRVVKNLMEPGKGILAVDETIEQIGVTLEKNGFENTHKNSVNYLVTLLGDSERWQLYVSGVSMRSAIFHCLRHWDVKRLALKGLEEQAIHIGIRRPRNSVPLAGSVEESTPTGLDRLAADCAMWAGQGASFVVFDGVMDVGQFTPGLLACTTKSIYLARSASICQRAGLVPVLSLSLVRKETSSDSDAPRYEPDDCDMNRATEDMLAFLTKTLFDHHVYLEGAIIQIKPILSTNPEIKKVAMATLAAIVHRIPPAIGGVMLSECVDLAFSTGVLNEMAIALCAKPCPLTFAWFNVIKGGLMKVWNGKQENQREVSTVMASRLKTCSQASLGHLSKNQFSIFVTKVSDDLQSLEKKISEMAALSNQT